MSLFIKQARSIVLCFFFSSSYAQSSKPVVQVDLQGNRYTGAQFDSVVTANARKTIVQRERIEKEDETQIIFEILTDDPGGAFRQRWIGKVLPSFTLKGVNGESYTNASLKGKVIVINFWSTTCGPCLKEMPLLSDLVNKYTSQNVIFLALAPQSSALVQKTISKRKFTYNVVPNARDLFTATGINSYPYHFIIDETGIVKDIYSGALVDYRKRPILDVRLVEAIDSVLNK